MKKEILLFFIIFSSLTAVIPQQDKKTEVKVTGLEKKDLKKVSSDIVKLFYNDKINDGFNILAKHWPISEKEISSIKTQMLNQLDVVNERFGRKIGYFLYDEQEAQDIFIRYTYIMKYENHIMRWVFTFYKPEDKWLINGFKWDDQIDSLF